MVMAIMRGGDASQISIFSLFLEVVEFQAIANTIAKKATSPPKIQEDL